MTNKGIIYIMRTVVPGLIKIGKTGTMNFESRMYQLEHNGYCNVTGLKKVFAIEVEDYEDKEKLLHTIFEKSQVDDTELFALDENIAVQLLSSFEGKVFFPKVKKEVIFNNAVENVDVRIPNGKYYFKKKKKSDNRLISAIVEVSDGIWIIKKGSILGINEDKGVTENVRNIRKNISIDKNSGELYKDLDLGKCSPSCAGAVVMNASDNGWDDWKTENGESIDKFRKNIEGLK